MELPVVNHEDYFAKIGDDHKFPINKFGELANYLIKNDIVKKFHREKMRKPVIDGIKKKIKPINYDLMGAILVGVSVARKTLDNPILSKLNDREYEKVLRHLFNAALNYKN